MISQIFKFKFSAEIVYRLQFTTVDSKTFPRRHRYSTISSQRSTGTPAFLPQAVVLAQQGSEQL
jgi:hypothetical protein